MSLVASTAARADRRANPTDARSLSWSSEMAYTEKASATATSLRAASSAIPISSLVTSSGPSTGIVGPLQRT